MNPTGPKIRYRDYSETDLAFVASWFNLHPSMPETWPMSLIEDLALVRRYEGKEAFAHRARQLVMP